MKWPRNIEIRRNTLLYIGGVQTFLQVDQFYFPDKTAGADPSKDLFSKINLQKVKFLISSILGDQFVTGAMVRASASQSVDLEFIFPSRLIPKDLCWQLSCLALSSKGMMLRTKLVCCTPGQGT